MTTFDYENCIYTNIHVNGKPASDCTIFSYEFVWWYYYLHEKNETLNAYTMYNMVVG